MNYYRRRQPCPSESPCPIVFAYYDDTVTHVAEDILIYNSERLLAAVGGSMGLTLGFSLMAAAEAAVAAAERVRQKREKTVVEVMD